LRNTTGDYFSAAPCTFTIASYYYSDQKVILILPSHWGRRLSQPTRLATYPEGLHVCKQ